MGAWSSGSLVLFADTPTHGAPVPIGGDGKVDVIGAEPEAQGARVPASGMPGLLNEVEAAAADDDMDDPFAFHSKRPPTGMCCTTTLLPRTSACPLIMRYENIMVLHERTSYIFNRPECTFPQFGTPVAIAYSCEECS